MNASANIATMVLERAQTGTIRFTEGFSGDEWYMRPTGVPSPAIWTLGHIALYRGMMVRLAMGEDIIPANWKKLFMTGTEPVDDPAAYPPPEELFAFLDLTHGKLKTWLTQVCEEELLGPIAGEHPFIKSKIQAVAVMPMHEAHHTGNLALLRRLLGKARII